MDYSILEDLGLSKSEITTYTTLLKIGTSSAKDIIYKSGLQSSVVHRALNSMIERGLIGYVLKGKHKVYSATDPEHFLRFIDEKRKRFETLLPELKKAQQSQRKGAQTSMYKGKRGISEVYSRLTALSGEELLTFGGSRETTDFMGLAWWKRMHVARVANKVRNRHIASAEVLPYIGFFLKLRLTGMRFLPKESFSQYQETAIIGDYVAISIFADEGYCVLIQNADVAEGYRKNFDLLWGQAREKK